MTDVIGEAKIVLDADTAKLIRQIETLKLPTVKVKVQLDRKSLAEIKTVTISPKFILSQKSITSIDKAIGGAIKDFAKEPREYILTGARFSLGKAGQNSIYTSVRDSITEASKLDKEFVLTNAKFDLGAKAKANLTKNLMIAVKTAALAVSANPVNIVAKVDDEALEASAVAASISARAKMQAILGKPYTAFLNANISGAVGAFSRFEVVSKRVFRNIGLAWGLTTAGIVAATSALAAGSIKAFSDVENSATNAASIVGGSALTEGGKSLTQATSVFKDAQKIFIEGAQKIARTTIFSATEAADGYYYLASAGVAAKDSLALLPQIAKYAQAGQFDLQDSTESLLQSFNALGMNVGDFGNKQKNITRLTDIMTKANIKSITDLQQLSDALKNRAAVSFTQYGQSVETAVAALQQFSKVGITGKIAGQQAGITLREVFTKGGRYAEAWKKNGLAVFDASGQYREFGDIIADFRKKFDTLNPQGQVALFKNLELTDKSTQGLRALIQAEAGGSLSRAAKELRDVDGLTANIAGFQMSSLTATFQNFKDAVQSLLIDAGEVPGKKLAQFFNQFNEGSELADKSVVAFKALGVQFGFLIDSVTGFINGPGLPAMSAGLRDLAVGTFKGIAGFGEEFAKAFGGENMTNGEAFGKLLSEIGKLSETVFPKVGKALGQITRFLVDHKEAVAFVAKVWLSLTAAIFATRVFLLPLQATLIMATTAFKTLLPVVINLGKALFVVGRLALPLVLAGLKRLALFVLGNPIILAIAGLVTSFTLLYKHSSKFRKFCQSISDAAMATVPGLQTATEAVSDYILKLQGVGEAAEISDKLKAFNQFKIQNPNATIEEIRKARARIYNEIYKPIAKKTFFGPQKLIGPLIPDEIKKRNEAIRKAAAMPKPVFGTESLFGAEDSKAAKKAQTERDKAQRQREAILKKEGRDIVTMQNKVQSALKSTNVELKKVETNRTNTLKAYFEAVQRAATEAKAAVSEFGDSITTALVGNLDPLKAQGSINASIDTLFKTLRENVGVLAGSDTERARTNLDALSSALSSIGDAAKGVAESQGAGAVGGFLTTQIGTLLTRAQEAFASGQLSADQLKQIQDQANSSITAATAVKIPVAIEAVDSDGNPVVDPRKNGVIAKFDALRAELVARSKNLTDVAGGLAQAIAPNGSSMIVGFTDGVKRQWTSSAQPYLQALGKSIPNAVGGTMVLQKRMTPHGEAIMLGLQDGMETVWKKDVTKFIEGVAPWISKNKGPVSADATLLTTHGTAIMGGLLDGLQTGWALVMNFIKGAAATMKDAAVAIGSSFTSAFSGVGDALGGLGGAIGGMFGGKFSGLIDAAATKFKIDPLLIASIIKAESGFKPNAVSPMGAQGLGQLMPATARGLGVKNAFDPEENINGTAKYIKQLLTMFGGNYTNAIAAYNAGPGAVKHAGGVPHFSETQDYVHNVLENLADYKKNQGPTPGGFPFSLAKTALLAATIGLDGANRLKMGPVGAVAKMLGLGVSAHGGKGGHHAEGGWHPKGLGLDLSGPAKKMASFAEMARTIFKPSELLYSPLGASYNGGPWGAIRDKAIKANHFSHVHVGNPHLLAALEKMLTGKVKGSRAMGGAHSSGTYLVGERGPELRSFGNSGEIISNANLNRMLKSMENSGRTGHGVNIENLNVSTNAQNPQVVGAAVASQIHARMITI